MRHSFVAILLGLIPLLALEPQDPAAPTGTVTGTITTTTRLAVRGTTTQRDIIFYLEPKRATASATPPAAAIVAQSRLTFVPHVLPVQKGATVTFRNDDAVTHNVLIEPKCCASDRDMEKGAASKVVFGEIGVFPVACRLHPEMAMHVVVVDTPWFVHVMLERQKGATGPADRQAPPTYQATFTLPDVPPGDYVLRTWNKRLPAFAQAVTVVAGKASLVQLAN